MLKFSNICVTVKYPKILVCTHFYLGEGKVLVSLQDNMIYKNGEEFAKHLSQGLADNWSQVIIRGICNSIIFVLC